jgi:hypothetical protein
MSEREPIVFQPVTPTKPAGSDLTNIVIYSIISVLLLTVVFYVCAYVIKVNTERRIMRERSALWRNHMRRPQVHVINPAEIMRNFPVRIFTAPKNNSQPENKENSDNEKAVDLSEIVVEQPGFGREKVTERPNSPVSVESENEPKDENLCAICLENYNEGECLRELPCHHFFHVAVRMIRSLFASLTKSFSASIPGSLGYLRRAQCARLIT